MLGETTFNTSESSSSILSGIEKSIKGDLNKLVGDIAKDLDIKDFYSAHVLDYCEGYYTPQAVPNLTTTISKNTTHCSNETSMFHFDPANIIQNELKPGVNLTDLKWPTAIEDAIRSIELASKVMFVVYCMGASAVGFALLGAILSIFVNGRLSAIVNAMISMVCNCSEFQHEHCILTFLACFLLPSHCLWHIYRHYQRSFKCHQQAWQRHWCLCI